MKQERTRAELNLHTKLSLLDSLIAPEEVLALAERYGLDAVAITDFHSVQAFPEIYRRSKEAGTALKIIYGAEIRCSMPEGGVFDLTLLVREQKGLKNLYQIISAIGEDETVAYGHVLTHREGLLLGWSCKNQTDDAWADCDYIELHPADGQKNKARMERLKETGDQPIVVAVSSARYTEKREGLWREGLRAQWELENDDPAHTLYLRTAEELRAELAYLGEETAQALVIDNPRRIAAMIGHVVPIPEGRHSFELPNAAAELCGICRTRAADRYGLPLPAEVEERMSTELSLILAQQHAAYYMLARKLVAHARSLGYPVGTRSSAASSFAAYLLGITEIDPLPPHYLCPQCKHSEFFTDGSVASGFDLPDKPCPVCGEIMYGDGHHIPFETFMGLRGEREPDIDLNVPAELQARLAAFLGSLCGEEHLVRGGTIGTTSRRMLAPVASYVEQRSGVIRPDEAEIMYEKLSGIKRTEGVHPGKYMLVPAELEISDFTPVRRAGGGTADAVSHFESHALSEPLASYDLLGHDTYTMLKLLHMFTGVDPSSVKINEPEIYALIRGEYLYRGIELGPLGLPEFGRPFMQDMARTLRPKCFSDLIKLSGFSHGTDVWRNNADGLFASGTAPLRELIAVRDDVFLTLRQHGISREKAYERMETVWKGKGGRLLSEQDARELGEHGIPEWYIRSCEKIMYLFPKAHCAEYVLAAVRLAWYKLHYPVEFYAAYYSTKFRDADPGISLDPAVYAECCFALEIEFLPPDGEKSDKRLFLPENGNIRRPLQ